MTFVVTFCILCRIFRWENWVSKSGWNDTSMRRATSNAGFVPTYAFFAGVRALFEDTLWYKLYTLLCTSIHWWTHPGLQSLTTATRLEFIISVFGWVDDPDFQVILLSIGSRVWGVTGVRHWVKFSRRVLECLKQCMEEITVRVRPFLLAVATSPWVIRTTSPIVCVHLDDNCTRKGARSSPGVECKFPLEQGIYLSGE